MEPATFTTALETNGALIARAFSELPAPLLRWRPASSAASGSAAQPKWSALEILGHLVDEERGDFRPRLLSTLEDPARPWPAIDPPAWVRERRHHERELADLLAEFERERVASLRQLAGLRGADWSRAHAHPQLGPIRAGDLLAAWAAHDLLHVRQLANTQLAYLNEAAHPFSTRYAG